jgi:hypothetical protein
MQLKLSGASRIPIDRRFRDARAATLLRHNLERAIACEGIVFQGMSRGPNRRGARG